MLFNKQTMKGFYIEDIETCQRIPMDTVLFAGRYSKLKSRVEWDRLAGRMENSLIFPATLPLPWTRP